MTQEGILELIFEVQQHQSELDDIEVKAANKGTPHRLYEPISAFANSTSGGVILFRLDEEGNYEIVGVGDLQLCRKRLAINLSRKKGKMKFEISGHLNG